MSGFAVNQTEMSVYCSLIPSLHCQLFFVMLEIFPICKKKKLAVETGYEAMCTVHTHNHGQLSRGHSTTCTCMYGITEMVMQEEEEGRDGT